MKYQIVIRIISKISDLLSLGKYNKKGINLISRVFQYIFAVQLHYLPVTWYIWCQIRELCPSLCAFSVIYGDQTCIGVCIIHQTRERCWILSSMRQIRELKHLHIFKYIYRDRPQLHYPILLFASPSLFLRLAVSIGDKIYHPRLLMIYVSML